MVTENDVLELLTLADELGIEVRIDGGWGVDALLGRPTRTHNDIDLFIDERHGGPFIQRLEEAGFRETACSFSTPAHRCWEDAAGRIVDLHLFRRGVDDTYFFEGATYPADIFSATGRIGGRQVLCIPAREQVLFHLGYAHDANDAHDVRLLCAHFGIPVPEEYQ